MNKTHIEMLRFMVEQDLDLVRHWRNHDAVNRFMFDRGLICAENHRQWFDRAKNDTARDLFIFEIDEIPQGFAQIVYAPGNSVAEWGFYAAPNAPKGTGEKMLRRVLKYVFEEKGAFKVYGQVLGFNEPSLRLHKKLGFKLEGVLRRHHYDGNSASDIYCFGMLSFEWRNEEKL